MICLQNLTDHAFLLDIETSGLHKQRDMIISIGVLFLDAQKQPTMKHWFLETKDQEKSIIEGFLLFLSSYEAIYTYNGKGFDYPFLLSRMQYYKIDTEPFLRLKLIDIKEVLKHFTRNRKVIESMLSFTRKSNTEGQEIIKLYRTYLAYHDPIYANVIIKHQEDELHSLLALHELYDTLFNSSNWKYLKHQKGLESLDITLQMPYPFTYSFDGMAFDMHFSYVRGSNLLHLTLPLINASLKHYLEPVKDYYYIESQGQLMHKSLAQFIPASLRRRATKEECSINKHSTYVKIYTTYKLSIRPWYDASKAMYIDLEDFSPNLLATQLFYLFFQKH